MELVQQQIPGPDPRARFVWLGPLRSSHLAGRQELARWPHLCTQVTGTPDRVGEKVRENKPPARLITSFCSLRSQWKAYRDLCTWI